MQIGFGVTPDENASIVPLWYLFHNRRHFNELMIELEPSKTDESPILMADGEHAAITDKAYFKVHRAFLSFYGTGTVKGHPKHAGGVPVWKIRCGFLLVFIILLVLIGVAFVMFAYLFQYLMSSGGVRMEL